MKNKNRIKLILAVVLVTVMIAYVGVNLYQRHIENVENMARKAELEMIRQEILDGIIYSDLMFFQNSFIYNDWTSDYGYTVCGEIDISEVVFVNSAEESEGFAEDVFVAWPTEGSEMFLELINGWLDPEKRGHLQSADMVIDINDLSVELPLKLELMVNDWETMEEIRSRLGRDGSATLRSIVERRFDPEKAEEETIED